MSDIDPSWVWLLPAKDELILWPPIFLYFASFPHHAVRQRIRLHWKLEPSVSIGGLVTLFSGHLFCFVCVGTNCAKLVG